MLLHINLFSAVFQTCSNQNDIAFFISIYRGQYALQGHATFKQTYKRKKYISKSDQLFLSTSTLIKPIIANGILFNSKKYLPSRCISIPCFFFFIFCITCFFFLSFANEVFENLHIRKDLFNQIIRKWSSKIAFVNLLEKYSAMNAGL